MPQDGAFMWLREKTRKATGFKSVQLLGDYSGNTKIPNVKHFK